MSSNIQVSSDIDTLLKKSTKEEVATFLGLEDTKAQWGQITGSLSSQTDLVSALAGKANASDVSTNTTNIATNATNIASNTADINSANDAIQSADTRLSGSISTNTANIATNTANIAINTAKVGITTAQANAIVANTAKVGITTAQATAISTNSQDLQIQSGAISNNASDIALKAPKASPTFTGDTTFQGLTFFEDTTEFQEDVEFQQGLTFTGGSGTELSISQSDIVLDNGSIGIRKTPSSALDVNGTIKANDLNIDSKAFYVDGTNSYIQAEKYGEGNFATLTGSENQPKTTPAFGDNGKVVENTYIKTFKIVGSGFVGLGGTPVTIVTKAGVGKYIVPQRMTVYNDYGTRSGEWGNSAGNASMQIGTFQNSDNTGNFAPLLVIPQSVAESSGDWLCHRTIRNAEVKQFANRDLCLKSLNNISSEANAPDGSWYVRLEYMVIGESAGFENNIDQTVGTPFA